MREIKFRAWDNGKSVFKLPPAMVSWSELIDLSTGMSDVFNNPDLILMQYTGLKDKNGVEIYEGDIVGGAYGYKKPYVVEWGAQHDSDISDFASMGFNVNPYDKKLEVIGNIYENEELLNG